MGLTIIGIIISIIIAILSTIAVRKDDVSISGGIGFFIAAIMGSTSIFLLIGGMSFYLPEKIELDKMVQKVEATQILITEIDIMVYNTDNNIDTLNINKLSKMIDLKSSLVHQKNDLEYRLNTNIFKCEHKFFYIFPFNKNDFLEYKEYLK